MTHEQKIKYMKVAAGVCGFGIREGDLDRLASIYELVMEKQGNTSIDDIVHVEFQVRGREEERVKQEIKKEKLNK